MRAEDQSAADRLLALVLNSGAHLWHNRPGLAVGDEWFPATRRQTGPHGRRARGGAEGVRVAPGLFVPAATHLYGSLLELYEIQPALMAHFASYSLTETEWRDLKVCCAALMLVQSRSGQPVRDDDGSIAFHDDDYRAVGEAMILHYEQGSSRMMTPKSVLRVAQLLENPDIAELNRAADFADPAGRRPPLGRWPRAARQWLAFRERNLPLLEGLVKAGYKETIKQIARKSGYRPESERFFEVLGWPQKQAGGGHRTLGLDGGMRLRRQERFDGLDEAEICERIVTGRLSYKEAVGRLPAGTGLTAAIMVALLPSLSDRELRLLTPTLEGLGLLADDEVRARWERAVRTATDQRALTIARNVHDRGLREKLEEAADNAARTAVEETIADDLEIMFLIDKSGSMEGAIEQSKEALSRILAGFPLDRLHIAAFDTTGWVLRPRAASRVAVRHMLDGVRASGGTTHGAAIRALHHAGVRIPAGHRLLVIVVGDEAGESGATLSAVFSMFGYRPAALAMIVNVAWQRGDTVRAAAAEMGVPFSEVEVAQFDDPYQVTRVLSALLDAPVPTSATFGWVEKVMATPLLEKPL
ncbi:VWA domain-containing protein [Spirillospora sp. NPDC047279]|uniref:VWA domain-containing protein n=1 Tax=Spirillospora sp. NPDC047279 TaxID=3155478 RepID=UPI0033F69DF2